MFTGEFSCCGGYGYTLGYTDWKHTVLGGAHNSVPDSCCLTETPSCGKGVFGITDLRVVIGKVHTHGCITTMLRRLDSHVNVRNDLPTTKPKNANSNRDGITRVAIFAHFSSVCLSFFSADNLAGFRRRRGSPGNCRATWSRPVMLHGLADRTRRTGD